MGFIRSSLMDSGVRAFQQFIRVFNNSNAESTRSKLRWVNRSDLSLAAKRSKKRPGLIDINLSRPLPA